MTTMKKHCLKVELRRAVSGDGYKVERVRGGLHASALRPAGRFKVHPGDFLTNEEARTLAGESSLDPVELTVLAPKE